MGYYTDGPIKTKSSSAFGTDYTGSENFINFIRNCLAGDPSDPLIYPGVGWTSTNKWAEITFTVTITIVDGDIMTLDGEQFRFYDTTPSGAHPVQISSGDIPGTLSNLSTQVLSVLHWTSAILGNSITFKDIGFPDVTITGNGKICSIFPAGSVGLWDSGIAPGVGYTHGGGWYLTSQALYSHPLELLVVTSFNSGFIIITEKVNAMQFTGLIQNNSWTITASKYQFFAYVLGSYGVGTFFMASHMAPLYGNSYCNFISGPIGVVFPFINGGARTSLDFSQRYYVNMSSGLPYSANVGAAGYYPIFVLPCHASGKNVITRGANPINFNLTRNDGKLIPFECFVALPQNSGELAKIAAAFWDSVLLSGTFPPDDSLSINSESGMVLLSQNPDQNNAGASFAIITNR